MNKIPHTQSLKMYSVALFLLFYPICGINAAEPNPLQWCGCEDAQYLVQASVLSGDGTTTISPSLLSYPYGAWIEITFTPAEGYLFDKWTGEISTPLTLSQLTETLVLQVTGDISVYAHSVPDEREVKVFWEYAKGDVQGQNMAYYETNISVGAPMTLTASPYPGFRTVWMGLPWDGDTSGYQYSDSLLS